MANVTITQLSAVNTLKGSDEFPIGRDGTSTNKVTYSTLSGSILSIINGMDQYLLENNGYVKFSNGLILQWGRTNNTVGGQNTIHTQNFHKPFISAPFVVVIGTYTSDSTVGSGAQRMAQVVSWQNNSFVWYSDNFAVQGAVEDTIGIHWFSIGV